MANGQRPEMLGKKKRLSWVSVAVLVLCALLLAFILLLIWVNAACFAVYVDGRSMEHTLSDGSYVYAYRSFQLERGEIIIVQMPSGELYVKRLIATEGDTVYAEGGTVYLMKAGTSEYEALSEPYLSTPTSDFAPVTVGEDEIFMMGDNRGVSKDSRTLGCQQESAVLGVVPDWAVAIQPFSTFLEQIRLGITGSAK